MSLQSTQPEAGHTQQRDWFHRAVVYQVYPRSFADSNGDGIGDLPGIIGRLDYLKHLGVDVVWLSPVYRSPQDDNGYDISDYCDIDPIFGTLEDLDTLITGLHARGMKLVMDLVVNHTSDEHPWFTESRSSKDNPKRDWYWWRPARPGFEPGTPGAEPTNWESHFSGPAWAYDQTTGEYYLHLFSKKQPDLNWENPDVRSAVYAMMNWWLDRGVDGFRMDVINFISKDPALPDAPTPDGRPYGRGGDSYICGPRIHEFLQEMHREVFANRDQAPLTVGEMPGVTIDEAALFTDPARAELDMVFQFEHVTLDRDGSKWRPKKLRLTDLKTSLGRWQAGLAERGWNSLYWSNHDQPRIVSRFGDDGPYRETSAKMLAGILHLHRGTPYIYQGEELGMTNMPFATIAEHRDIEALNHYREATLELGLDPVEVLASMASMNRDNGRTPVQWNAGPNAGFTTGTPWMSVNHNALEINAEEQIARDDSVFNFYRRLIGLRHELPVIAHGDFTKLLPENECVYAFIRRHGDQELLVLGNFTPHPQPVDIGDPSWAQAQRIIGNYPHSRGLDLAPWELTALLRTRA
ncbi:MULTISPECIES: alpha-glucosidase [Arthrobacter]|uniref:Alpha-glucosidase n=1 Tax=Arthrobacter terricola TaxID=2547396 RepID=A0A4R5KYZ7_9MICC|nr:MULTISPECIES: alpha-glucosidase [Arthrobacter]MBT8160100.1 alpha-glucosidase [Arthrobacter sp. GN70]TDG01097.1 alpha-glucosidase [Arthrobacter terricola]